MKTIASHRTAILLSILVGFVYGSHHFFIPYFLGSQEYYPVTGASQVDMGLYYGPRARAVYEGQWFAGDISVIENKESPSMLPLLNPLILGGLGRIAGSLERAFILSDFLFPALIFLAVYALSLEFADRRFPALMFSSLFMFSPKLWLFLPPVSSFAAKELFHSVFLWTKPEALYFTRFEYPKITFLFYVLAVYFLLRAMRDGGWKHILMGGLSFGLVFYTYLYDWAYIITALAIFQALLWRDRGMALTKRLMPAMAVSVTVASFWLVNMLRLKRMAHYHDLFLRFGVEISRSVRVSTWTTYARNAGLAGVLVWLAKKKPEKKFEFLYLASFLLAMFAVLNVQVVLGFNPQADHWYRIQFLPVGLAFFVIALFCYDRLKSFPAIARYASFGGIILMLFIFGAAGASQYAYSGEHSSLFTLDSAYASSYTWLNNHTDRFSVVGSIALSTNHEILLHTHNKVFMPTGFNTMISDAEITDRFLRTARMYSLAPERVSSMFADQEFYFFHERFRDTSLDTFFRASRRVVDSEMSGDVERAYRYISGMPAKVPYQLNYLYYGPREKSLGKDPGDMLQGLKKVYDANGVIIYKL